MVFHGSRWEGAAFVTFNSIQPNELNTLTSGDGIINRVSHTKFLGTYVDQDLKWKYHVEHVRKKLCGLYAIRNV